MRTLPVRWSGRQLGRRSADRRRRAALGRDRRELGRRASRRRATPRSAWPSSPQLLDTAIANADSRDQLMRVAGAPAHRRRRGPPPRRARPARRRAAAAGAHDRDAQARSASVPGRRRTRPSRSSARRSTHAEQGNRELRELAHGILPAALTARWPPGRRRRGRGTARPAGSRSTSRPSGSRPRSRRARTSSWPRR